MTTNEKEQLKRFASNVVLTETVRSFLRQEFTKKRTDRDVHMLAGQMIAVELLDDAFKVIERMKKDQEKDKKSTTNIAV